jgi:8-oxo-dGTP pyrophosphatase MutT (NUDIX family)
MQESARGILLTPGREILLMAVATRSGRLWVMPGGRIQPGEEPPAAAVREVAEETGRQGLVAVVKVWIREGTFLDAGVKLPEREHFFLMPTARFEPSPHGMEAAEVGRHRGFRWWTIEEIARSSDRFAPMRLAALLRDLVEHGPPPFPVATGE